MPGPGRQGGLRGYADHLGSDVGRAALRRLIETAKDQVTAILCAEAEPAQCHRQLIADALVARGWEVVHILGPGENRPHELHPVARTVHGRRLIYPASAEQKALF